MQQYVASTHPTWMYS